MFSLIGQSRFSNVGKTHLELKKEATKPGAKNLIQQQGKFDRFIEEYNHERPHQAIGMKYPAELYVSSSRPNKVLRDLEYPFHDRTITVTCGGRICIGRRNLNISTVFARQNVGIKAVSDEVWLMSFMRYDLDFFDHETGRVTSAENSIGAKLQPACPERILTDVLGKDPRINGSGGVISPVPNLTQSARLK